MTVSRGVRSGLAAKAAMACAAAGLWAASGAAQAQLLGGLLGGTTTTAAPASAPAAINKNTGQQIPNGSVLLVWSSDGCSLPTCNPNTAQDFLAVVDVEPNSTTFGNVIWTAELPSLVAGNVLPNAWGDRTDQHNDPHHMLSYTSYISGGGDGLVKDRKYTFAGGVISKNVFRYDITSVRSIGKAELAVCGTQPRRSSLTDDFIVMPSTGANHKILYTYMGNYVYGPQGTVTEIDPGRVAPSLLGVCTAAVPAVVPLLENVTELGCIGGNAPDDNALLGHAGITEYPGCVQANQPRNPTNYTARRTCVRSARPTRACSTWAIAMRASSRSRTAWA